MEDKFYALYTRVSTEDQATKEGSLVSQAQRLMEYLEYSKVSNGYLIYQDEGSGKDTKKRSGFRKMMEDIEAGKVKAVVCTEISRVSRSVIDFQQFMKVCEKNCVGFVSLREKFDTTTSQGKLIMSIFSSLAQFESEQIAERTSANLRARSRRGLFNGGFIYGYKPRKEQRGYLDIEESEAFLVKKIYEKYLAFGSYSKVTLWLNDQGYRFRNGKKWNKNTVLMILRNPAYIAKRKIEGVLLPMLWNPILDEEIWNQVQDILKRNYGMRKNSRKHQESHCFLFRGLIFCGKCESLLESSSGINHQGKKYFYYRHSHRSRKPGCDLPFCYPAETVEEMLYSKILMGLKDESMINTICGQVSQKMKEELEDEIKEGNILDKELVAIENEVESLIKAMVSLPHEQVQEFIVPRLNLLSEKKRRTEVRIRNIKEEIYRLTMQQIKPEEIREMAGFLEKEYKEMDKEEKQKIMRLFVERIEIHGDTWSICMRVYNKIRDLHEKVRVIPDWLPEHSRKRTFFIFEKLLIFIKKRIFYYFFLRKFVFISY